MFLYNFVGFCQLIDTKSTVEKPFEMDFDRIFFISPQHFSINGFEGVMSFPGEHELAGTFMDHLV